MFDVELELLISARRAIFEKAQQSGTIKEKMSENKVGTMLTVHIAIS